MNNIIDFSVFNENIFLNASTGKFSFSIIDCFSNGIVDYNLVVDSFKPKFISICLSISNACNLSCDYCFNNNKDGTSMKTELAIEIIDKMINKFSECDKFYVDLSGYGEPLLFLDKILKIKDFCNNKSNEIKREILVSFVSNGTLLYEEIAYLLQKKGILFGVSLDGNEYVHDKHRKNKQGEKTFNQIINNIKSIKNRDYIGCAVSITNDVFDLESTVIDLLKYFKTISIKPVRSSNGEYQLTNINEWLDQYDKLTIRIISDLKLGNIEILKALLNGDDYFGKFIFRCFMDSITINRCDAGITRYSFDKEGNCFGCPSLSMDSSNLIDNIDDYKSRLKKQVYATKEECAECHYKLICGGECNAEYLNLRMKNPHMCMLKKGLIQRAMYIKLICQKDYSFSYNELIGFCLEKKNRFKRNLELERFIEENNYDFVEGKRIFDSIEKKY